MSYTDPFKSVDLCLGFANTTTIQNEPPNTMDNSWDYPDSQLPTPSLHYESSVDNQSNSSPYEHMINNFSFLDNFDFTHDFFLFPDTSSVSCDGVNDFDTFFALDEIPSSANEAEAVTTTATAATNRFRCDCCPESFGKKYELNRHTRKHTLPHECEECHKTFAERRDLNRHVRSCHSSESSEAGWARCHVCGYAAARADSVKRHIRIRHRDRPRRQPHHNGTKQQDPRPVMLVPK